MSITELIAEQAKLRERLKKIRAERERIEQRLFAIEREQHRLTIAAAVGQLVRIRFRLPSSDRCHALNDVAGTLVSVRRTRASVDFGTHGKWDWAIDELLLAANADMQGFTFGGEVIR